MSRANVENIYWGQRKQNRPPDVTKFTVDCLTLHLQRSRASTVWRLSPTPGYYRLHWTRCYRARRHCLHRAFILLEASGAGTATTFLGCNVRNIQPFIRKQQYFQIPLIPLTKEFLVTSTSGFCSSSMKMILPSRIPTCFQSSLRTSTQNLLQYSNETDFAGLIYEGITLLLPFGIRVTSLFSSAGIRKRTRAKAFRWIWWLNCWERLKTKAVPWLNLRPVHAR